MYAKLVVGGTAVPAQLAMRDIVRLITSSSPSTSLLGGFSTSSSVIIDATPAGWTYVGSNNAADQPTLAGTGATGYVTAGSQSNLVVSAPCLEGSALKYAALSQMWLSTMSTANNYFALTSATGSTNLGVLTNEGPRYWVAGASQTTYGVYNYCQGATAGAIIHLVANPRHITIVQEGRGMAAVWEMSMTDANRFYGTAPIAQYSHGDSTNSGQSTIIIPTNSGTTARTGSIMTAINGITDVNTGTYYGTYDVTISSAINVGNWIQNRTDFRKNSITSTGGPAYQVSPIWLQAGPLGHPAQSITGVSPVYWTSGSIGSTGDTLIIAGDSYTYFNAGAGFGLAMMTS